LPYFGGAVTKNSFPRNLDINDEMDFEEQEDDTVNLKLVFPEDKTNVN